mgnify:CR=1 FL=1
MIDEKIYDATSEANFEERSKVDPIREDGRITKYKFKILIHNAPALEGELTRDEVDLMFRLYASEGAGLTQRTVSRYFPLYTFSEFKKIKNAFNLTKSSVPFAPHVIEEHTTDELVNLQNQQLENNFLKKYEQTKESFFKARYEEILKQHKDLKEGVSTFKEFLGSLSFTQMSKWTPTAPRTVTDITLNVYISDMHTGADVSKYAIFNNTYNQEEMINRIDIILEEIFKITDLYSVDSINICNLGDSLDGYNGQTTRGGHKLPQNLNNKDQFKTYIDVMLYLFKKLSESGYFNNISYICVEGGNHDGDFGYFTNKALEASLNTLNPNIRTHIFEQFMDYFEVGDHTFILCHGKDATDMFKNLPLTINVDTENKINAYLDYVEIPHHQNIHFIKGDLHQSATTFAKRVRYKSVGSFFGSSEWIQKNFGFTKAVCDMDIIMDDQVLETRILLQ